MIAPAFVLPSVPGGQAAALWALYDGSLDGSFASIATAQADTDTFFTALARLSDPSIGVVFRQPVAFGTFDGRMFSISSLTSVAALGSDQSISNGGAFIGFGDFTVTNNRIWQPFGDGAFGLWEYDGTGLIGSQGPSDVATNAGFSPVTMTDLDATRAVWSIPATSGGLEVSIAQRSGGTLVSTVNSVTVGSTAISNHGSVRPLHSTRSLAVYMDESSPAKVKAQGIAHSGTTPSLDGTAVEVGSGAEDGSFQGYIFLSRNLDGLGSAKGRFLCGWRDESTGDIQLRMIGYDGSTITLGMTVDTGIAFTGTSFNGGAVLELGDGVALVCAVHNQSASDGWFIVEYTEAAPDDLSLAVSSAGLQGFTLDGSASGDTVTKVLPFAISANRFGLAVLNETDTSIDIKVVHNGGDG